MREKASLFTSEELIFNFYDCLQIWLHIMPEVLNSIDGDGCVVKDVETSNTASANLKPRDPDDIAVVDRAINGNAA